jgi:hypothetical protein
MSLNRWLPVLALVVLTVACSKKNKDYMECGQDNEKAYYGKWNISIATRDSVNSAPHLVSDSAVAYLHDDEDHLTTVNPITLYVPHTLESFKFLNDYNNAQLWYWSPDLSCGAHGRFNIYTNGFRDLILTFNVTEFSAAKVVMTVIVPVNTGNDMGIYQAAEEWTWTR